MIMKNNSSIFNLVRKLTILFILLAGSAMFIADVSAASSLKPTVSGFKVFPSTVSNSGGSVLLSAKVSNATRCIITVKPAISGVGYNKPCSSGMISYRITLPSNSTKSNILYAFKLLVTGRTGEGNVTAPLETAIVTAPPKPVISSFVTPTTTLTSAGGNVILTASVSHETSCSLSVSPAISQTLGSVPCSTGSVTFPQISLLANSSDSNIDYTFTLTVTGSNGTVSDNLIVTVDSSSDTGSSTTTTTPPSTTTTTSPTTTTTTPPSTTVGNTVGVPAEPDALLQVGNNIWVASCSGNAVTEINKNSKQIIDELNSSKYNFNCPDALTSDGPNIWVANSLGNSITILNSSTGAFVSNLTGSSIINPIAFATVATNVWVLDSSNQINTTVLSEFNSSGTFLNQVIDKVKGNNWFLTNPECITSTGNNFWVSDEEGEQLIEFSGANGHFIRFSEGSPAIGLSHTCVTYSNGYIWASTEGGPEIVEFNASTGVYVKEISNILNTNQLISEGNYLFVVSSPTTDVVKEYNISTSKLIKVIAKSNIGHGNGIRSILYDGDSLWTANYSSSSVSYYNV
ncbi:MAG TPA: hypothetical protein VMQ58_02405 [Candidatus Saccharimonadales bacterium]|nr:hypothetical protein [Candidatus Saccharimonadales bacterium]